MHTLSNNLLNNYFYFGIPPLWTWICLMTHKWKRSLIPYKIICFHVSSPPLLDYLWPPPQRWGEDGGVSKTNWESPSVCPSYQPPYSVFWAMRTPDKLLAVHSCASHPARPNYITTREAGREEDWCTTENNLSHITMCGISISWHERQLKRFRVQHKK